MPKFSLHSKLNRIQKLIAEFENGNTPQARDVSLVLSRQQNATMDAAWIKQKTKRLPSKSAALKVYEQQLKVAAMWHGRLERYKVNQPTANQVWVDRVTKQAELQSKVDAELQSAKHALVQALHTDSAISAWLDRHVVIVDIDHMGLDDMPRCITSRSQSNLANTAGKHLLGKQSIREIKLAALRGALEELQREIDVLYPPLSEEQHQQQNVKLKHLLARMKGVR